jgi:site-specific recombinase XerD
MASTLNSSGIRIGELIYLKITEIDGNRMLSRVEQGRGKMIRFTLLGDSLLEKLRSYFLAYKSI